MTAGTFTKRILGCLAVVAVAAGAVLLNFGTDDKPAPTGAQKDGAGASRHQISDARNLQAPAGTSSGPATTLQAPAGDYHETMTIVPVAGQSGTTKVINVSMTVPPSTAKTSTTSWQNTSFAVQSGAFVAEFDSTPNSAAMDGVTALSPAAISSYSDAAVSVRFNSTGTIDARNGGNYAAATSVAYVVGKSYHFRLVINIPAHTYSIYVTPAGASEVTLGSNYAFRTEQASATNLANWGLIATAGSHSVSNFQLSAGPLSANAGPDASITAGGSTQLAGTATGGTPPYTFSWSPGTSLSSATIANPTASPTVTITYNLTVRDAANRTAGDSMTLTVGSVPSGTVYYVSTTGSDSSAGTSAAPWKTLAKAAATAQAGSTVIVRAGTYYETLRPTYSGLAAQWISFKSESALGAIIDGQNSRSTGVDLSRPNKYIRVEGFAIRNHTGNAVHMHDYYGRGADYNQIVGCAIYNNAGDAVSCRNTVGTLVENCDIYDNGLTAVAMGGQYYSRDLVIRGNKIHHNAKDGIQGSCYNMLVEDNYLYDQFHTDAHQDAFDLETLDGGTIRHNTITDNTQLVYSSTGNGHGNYWQNVKIYCNVFYNYRYWTVGGLGGPGTCPGVNIGTAYTDNYLQNIEIFNNTFGYLGDGQKAITIYGVAGSRMDNIKIFNNIFYDCRGAAGDAVDWSSNATNVTLDYNCYYVVRPRSGYDQHSIQADPKFVAYSRASSWNFHLQSTSPCINAGNPNLASVVSLPSPFLDCDDKARPLGVNYDIGAYEAQ